MSYAALKAHYDRLHTLDSALGILRWDMATMMPTGAAGSRGEQLATLGTMSHELRTQPQVSDWLDAAHDEALDDWQRANLREASRDYLHATALSSEFVAELTRATSRCETVWLHARPNNDFATLIEPLSHVIELVKQKATILSEATGKTPYDALLSQYEPDGSSDEIDTLFSQLAAFLPDLVGQVLARQDIESPPLIPEGPFPIEPQKKIGLKVMEAMGFEFENGRLDVSAHPFCGGHPDDVRITTRYTTEDFTQSLMGIIHETGHALYERGLPAAYRGQPVGRARSMGIHESQSILMEMQAGRSDEFMRYLTPLIRQAFGQEGPAWTDDNLRKIYRRVSRGLIRVDADEVTYPLHVVLRYRLERALLSGDLLVHDLPGAWREGMAELVGVEPTDDTNGCMQDIHWHMGAIGYFPTYTLGAMNAAQLYAAATQDDDQIKFAIERGNFAPLLAWLRPNVHAKASRYSATELLEQATGRPLDVEVFRAHLERRYLGAER